MKDNSTRDQLIKMIDHAIENNAKLSLLADFGTLRTQAHINLGDHPLEKARFIEKFARWARSEANKFS